MELTNFPFITTAYLYMQKYLMRLVICLVVKTIPHALHEYCILMSLKSVTLLWYAP